MLTIGRELSSYAVEGDHRLHDLHPAPIDDVWDALWTGRERIVASRCTESECHLELEPEARSAPLKPILAETLQRLLRGQSQKFIALDCDCSASTVATRARSALEQLGLRGSPARVPAALVVLAHTAWGILPELLVRCVDVPGTRGRRLISAPRPNPRKLHLFSPAELALVEMMIEAQSRLEMGQARRSSLRTIANQIAQIYRKLRVSGRIPLLIELMQSKPAQVRMLRQ